MPGRSIAFDHMYELGDPPNYEPAPERVDRRARRVAGREPAATSRSTCCSTTDGRGAAVRARSSTTPDGNLDADARHAGPRQHRSRPRPTAARTWAPSATRSFPTTLLTLWGRDRAEGRFELPVPGAAALPRHGAHRRPARSWRAGSRLPGRRERHRLRAPAVAAARVQLRPARGRPAPAATGRRLSPHVRGRSGDLPRRRADRCAAGSAASRRAAGSLPR